MTLLLQEHMRSIVVEHISSKLYWHTLPADSLQFFETIILNATFRKTIIMNATFIIIPHYV